RPSTAMPREATMPGEATMLTRTVPGKAAVGEASVYEAVVPVRKAVAPVAMKPAITRDEHDSVVAVVAVGPVPVGSVANGLCRASRHGQADTEQQQYCPRHD